MWKKYRSANTIEEAISALTEAKGNARLIAGGTDLMLEMERGVRQGVDVIIDISRIPGLDRVWLDDKGLIHIGATVTHNQALSSPVLRQRGLPLAQACWEVGSPQIRNRGTIVGNLVTGSPANDTITPLMALGAELKIVSQRGTRFVSLETFYTGVRKTVLAEDEIVVEIVFPSMRDEQTGVYLKTALRRAQAISVVNIAIILTQEGKSITNATITMGAVAPKIIHAVSAEKYLIGKELDKSTIQQAGMLAAVDTSPISDLRGSDKFRKHAVEVSVVKGLLSLLDGTELETLPEKPVLLATQVDYGHLQDHTLENAETIETTINGKHYSFDGGEYRTLLQLIREGAGLTGTKEGCGEGECGACTVIMDGKAVMSCLVPAPRANGAEITTIEGLKTLEGLHPVQEAFMNEGAVQCGFCTPGFIMSAVKMIEESPELTEDQIKQGLTGNLCRCTGYYAIIKAVERAAATAGRQNG